MVRLIISDIDGTLVPEGCTALNPEYFKVIRDLADLGVSFAAASGRQKSSVDAVFHEICGMIYYVSDNGGFIQKNGIPLRKIYMDREKAGAVSGGSPEPARMPGASVHSGRILYRRSG